MSRFNETIKVQNMEDDFRKNGILPEKFWNLKESDRTFYLNRYVTCFNQEVSNRRFNKDVYKMVVEKKKQRFFSWIKKTMNYKNIKI